MVKNNKTHSDRGLNSNSYPCVLATKESERVVEEERGRERGGEGGMDAAFRSSSVIDSAE